MRRAQNDARNVGAAGTLHAAEIDRLLDRCAAVADAAGI
jgi:hypothetical protein